ncbi:hypothetical protein [Staphylococcus xylosus]|uniref:hypothetical protein n=1 Tax=Staphylococcus xylosus TaxID=1288 RepID=UPI003F56E50C
MTENEMYLMTYIVMFIASLISTIGFYKLKEYKCAIGSTFLTMFTLFASIVILLRLMEVI